MTTMGKEASLNELRISNEEYEALTKCQPEVRYQYTLKRIADTETMWSIVGDKNSFAIQPWKRTTTSDMVFQRICSSILYERECRLRKYCYNS